MRLDYAKHNINLTSLYFKKKINFPKANTLRKRRGKNRPLNWILNWNCNSFFAVFFLFFRLVWDFVCYLIENDFLTSANVSKALTFSARETRCGWFQREDILKSFFRCHFLREFFRRVSILIAQGYLLRNQMHTQRFLLDKCALCESVCVCVSYRVRKPQTLNVVFHHHDSCVSFGSFGSNWAKTFYVFCVTFISTQFHRRISRDFLK